MKDLSYDHETAIAWALPIMVAALVVVLLPHALLYRENAFTVMTDAVGLPLGVAVFFVSIIVHELLHTATVMAAGGLRWDQVSYGVNWKTLTPYAHPKVPVTARVYAATVAAPGILMGLIPAAFGLATGSGAWSGYGALMLAAAGGDILILWSLRRTPGSALVQDHPSRVGCLVSSEDGLTASELPSHI
jgi:hypothetical protein